MNDQWVPDRIMKYLRLWRMRLRKVPVPFVSEISLYDLLSFFIRGIIDGAITSRAGSVSYSFFMAIFPALIFFFTLIPYIQIEGFQKEIFELLQNVMPPNSFEAVESTIRDIVTNKRGGLLSIGFIATLLFATNGTLSLLSNFSYTTHSIEIKNFWNQYITALGLTLVLSVLTIIGTVLLLFSESVGNFLVEAGILERYMAELLQIARAVILILLIQISISIIFRYGPTKEREWHFISPGSVLATLLMVGSSIAFGYYIENFSQYNKLYGSIGTLLIIMLWIYINSLGLIIGFELNASIVGAKKKVREKQENSSKL
ncbi:MAG: YihY/virulence factor BrkB family protein [Bacteroidota bacterium]|nr:YihY/virulence factor BrkB family protein [Bacteroidota bacterium]MDX5506046.1 YihY/virulence factor BrkB family protein [Bacteroidota bacterium]